MTPAVLMNLGYAASDVGAAPPAAAADVGSPWLIFLGMILIAMEVRWSFGSQP